MPARRAGAPNSEWRCITASTHSPQSLDLFVAANLEAGAKIAAEHKKLLFVHISRPGVGNSDEMRKYFPNLKELESFVMVDLNCDTDTSHRRYNFTQGTLPWIVCAGPNHLVLEKSSG